MLLRRLATQAPNNTGCNVRAELYNGACIENVQPNAHRRKAVLRSCSERNYRNPVVLARPRPNAPSGNADGEHEGKNKKKEEQEERRRGSQKRKREHDAKKITHRRGIRSEYRRAEGGKGGDGGTTRNARENPASRQTRPMSVEVGRCWPTIYQAWPHLAVCWPTSTKSSRSQARVGHCI